MRLKDFKVGETYYVASPNVRLARIQGEGEWEYPTNPDADAGDHPMGFHTRKCLHVLCTAPDVPITGLVTKAGAKRNANIKAMAKGQTEDREWDYRVWEEIWSERKVGKLRPVPGGKAMERADLSQQGGNPSQYEIQAYCVAVRDMKGRMLTGPNREVARSPFRSSSIPGRPVEKVTHVPKTKMKGDPFTLQAEEKEVA